MGGGGAVPSEWVIQKSPGVLQGGYRCQLGVRLRPGYEIASYTPTLEDNAWKGQWNSAILAPLLQCRDRCSELALRVTHIGCAQELPNREGALR